jgi:hypothetical protein
MTPVMMTSIAALPLLMLMLMLMLMLILLILMLMLTSMTLSRHDSGSLYLQHWQMLHRGPAAHARRCTCRWSHIIAELWFRDGKRVCFVFQRKKAFVCAWIRLA